MSNKYLVFFKFIFIFSFFEIPVTALSPESWLLNKNESSLLFLKKINNIEDLSKIKKQELNSQNYITDNILIEEFIKKEILVAKKNAILFKHCLFFKEYYNHFSYALDRIMKTCEFFRIDLDTFIKLFMPSVGEKELFKGFKHFLQYVDSVKKRGYSFPNHGKLPGSLNINKNNYKKYLNDMLATFKLNRHSIKNRTEAILKIQHGTITPISKDYLIEECVKSFDFFLNSQSFAIDFYEELLTLTNKANLSFKELRLEVNKRQSLQYKNLVELIKNKGPINYAELMKILLYDEKYGFYTKNREGAIAGGDFGFNQEFSTIPENSPLFGMGIAIDCYQKWLLMGKPTNFSVIEMGAGESGLAYYFMRTVIERKETDENWEFFFKSLNYKIIDINTKRISDLRMSFLKDYVEFIEGDAISVNKIFSANSITGVFLSNELTDAFPVHKIRMVNGKINEVCIKEVNGFLIETDEDILDEDIIKFIKTNKIQLFEGQEKIINVLSMKWLENIYHVLNRGYILTFDYGALTKQDALTQNLFQPLFRMFGDKRDKIESNFFGVPESMGNEIFGIEPYEGFLSNENITSEDDIEKVMQEAFRARQYILKEYFNSILVAPFDLDITTDVSFTYMTKLAISLSLKTIFVGDQQAYFDNLRNVDETWNERVPIKSFFLNELDGYFVSIFQKESNLEKTLKTVDSNILIAS